jgi:hypothetical protein
MVFLCFIHGVSHNHTYLTQVFSFLYSTNYLMLFNYKLNVKSRYIIEKTDTEPTTDEGGGFNGVSSQK